MGETHTFDVQVKRHAPERKPAPEPKKQVEEPPKIKWWILLPIPILIVFFVLISSAELKPFEKTAEERATTAIAQKILADADSQYPTLSPQEKARLSSERLEQALQTKDAKQLIGRAQELQKNQFRDETGTPYIFEGDSYFYLRYAGNIVNRGHPGETLKKDKPFDTLRRAPNGRPIEKYFFATTAAIWHKAWKTLEPQTTIMKTTFYLPVFLGIISTILIFFITLKIFKRTETAFFASTIFAIHPYFFRQNIAGLADTPTILMPLSLAYFLGVLYTIEGTKWQRITGAIGAIITLLILKQTWNGWFFVLGITAAYCAAYAIMIPYTRKLNKKDWIIAGGTATLGAIITAYLYITGEIHKLIEKLQFTDDIPGIQKTVQELQSPSLSEYANIFGGPLFDIILATAIIWMAIKIIRKKATNTELFVFIWLIVMIIPVFRVVRFVFFLVPPAVILAGWLMQKAQYSLSRTGILSAKISSIILLIALPLGVGATMLDTSKLPFPVMSDGTIETANWIKQNTAYDSVINTWWDLGYVWQYTTKRATILDAGPDLTAYWMAEAFITKDEKYAEGILRMLNCNGIQTFVEYREKLGIKSVRTLEKVLRQTKEEAEQTLEEAGAPELINGTHCEPREAYLITDQRTYSVILSIYAITQWDEELGIIKKFTKEMEEQEAIEYLQKELNVEQKEASQLYYDSLYEKISPTPRKTPTEAICKTINETEINCGGYVVTLEPLSAIKNEKRPNSVALIQNGTRTEKTYGENAYAIIVYQEDETYKALFTDPEFKDSMVTKWYVEENVKGYTPVHRTILPERIVTIQINWTALNTLKEASLPSET